jgi:hypothetical protein
MLIIGLGQFTRLYPTSGMAAQLLRPVNKSLEPDAMHTALSSLIPMRKMYWSMTSQAPRTNSSTLYWLNGLLMAQIIQ